MRLQLQPGSWLGTPISTLESELPNDLLSYLARHYHSYPCAQ